MMDEWDVISREVAETIGAGEDVRTEDEDDETRITTEDVLRLFETLDELEKSHHLEDTSIELTWDEDGRMSISVVPAKDANMNEG